MDKCRCRFKRRIKTVPINQSISTSTSVPFLFHFDFQSCVVFLPYTTIKVTQKPIVNVLYIFQKSKFNESRARDDINSDK